MKKKICSICASLALLLAIIQFSHGQELFQLNSTGLDEETITPHYQFEYIPDFTYEQVEQRIKAMETSMPFELNERIFAFINYFAVRNRDYTKMVLQRMDTYFPMFEEMLSAHDMPDDVKFLAIIESGLNPKAKSRVGAMGLWQFMPATGRMYNMHTNMDIDDRMDPEMSTEAAAKYLKSLYRMFNDWEVALAAYNCGPGNVRKAIRRSGGKSKFWDLYNYLPRETRSYIPQFQAMMYLIRHAEEHNFVLEEPSYPIAFEKINFNQELDLEELANLTGICIEDIEYLNPSIQHRLVPASNKSMAIRVPKSKVEYITENKEHFASAVKLTTERAIDLRLASNQSAVRAVAQANAEVSTGERTRVTYKVKSGDVLGKIAQNHGTTVTNIKAWNNLSNNNIRIGQTLYIYTKNGSFDNSIAANNSSSENPKVYTVQPGDSLWLISKKLSGISVEQIKRLNNLNTNQIKPGQKLIIG
jgi:membrane-bound lytic murein transglycosylase D